MSTVKLENLSISSNRFLAIAVRLQNLRFLPFDAVTLAHCISDPVQCIDATTLDH